MNNSNFKPGRIIAPIAIGAGGLLSISLIAYLVQKWNTSFMGDFTTQNSENYLYNADDGVTYFICGNGNDVSIL
ncbi:MAG TPA: hypothetical protein VK625_08985 [Flavitalea sp.]|nr:hypothetical protein [Flavitalea sp.]